MPKMVFVMDLKPESVSRIQAIAPTWEIIYGKGEDNWANHLADAEIIGGWNKKVLTEAVNVPAPKLRWVQNWGAGVDHLPCALLHEKHILVTNASGVHAYPIAETILGMMLALTRRLHVYVRNQQERKWHHGNLSLELHGKTVGILGVGAIGLETARLCKAFNMRVLGVRRSGEPTEYVDEMVALEQLQEILPQCDYVVNTLPATPETFHLIGKPQFESMKTTSYYINIGRGSTTDESAMIAALTDNRIAGAGLDVFEKEPLPADSPLWDLENVILTPHTSGSTQHYEDRVMDIFLPNLQAYISGRDVTLNRVNLELQY